MNRISTWFDIFTCPHCGSERWNRNKEMYSCGTPRKGSVTIEYKQAWYSKYVWWNTSSNRKYIIEDWRSDYCKSLEFANKVKEANKLLKDNKLK